MATERDAVELVDDETVTRLARSALVAALMAASAWLALPWFGTVEVTFQVLVVFLAGIYLGPAWGTASIVIYLVAGAVGAPVFAGGSAGVGQILGPTGGYLVAFPIGAFIVGAIVHRGRTLRNPQAVSPTLLAGAMALATAVIYAIGVAWLGHVAALAPWEAFVTGAALFIPWEVLEIAIVLAVVRQGVIDVRSR